MGRVLKVREIGDPILSTKCREVDIKNINQEILKEIEDLKETLNYTPPAHPVLQVAHGDVDGGGLHPVPGVDGGGGALLLREDQGQVLLLRAAARLHAAVD